MSVSFKFCGKLNALKETENFNPDDLKVFEKSGWAARTFKFQGTNGDNKHFLQVQSGYWANNDGSINEEKTDIYTLQNAEDFETNKKAKPKSIRVKYSDRMNEEIVKNVPAYKKLIVDLNMPGEKKEEKLRKDYIFENDFIEALKKILASEKYKDLKYNVSGTVDMRYSESKAKFYKSFIVQRVSLAPDDAKESMTVSGKFIFSSYSWDDDAYGETGKIKYNVWNRYYDNQYKKDSCKGMASCPFEFVFAPSNEKVLETYTKRMSVVPDGADYGEISIVAEVIDGAQVEKLTFDDLPEDVREDIELGLADLEEELRKAGGSAYGERITEYRIVTARDAVSSDYDDEITIAPVHDVQETVGTSVKHPAESENEDLFDLDIV